MKRLTKKFEHSEKHSMKCAASPTCPMNCECCTELDCIVNRLGAYEDTGLTPERCAEYGKADREGRYIVLRDAEQEGVKRLRELAEADKSGRAVILPCELGTPVYMTYCGEVWEMRVGQFHVNGHTKQRIWADIDCDDCDWVSTQCVRWDLAVGKTIFLTREEAEAALKEVQNGNETDM